MKTQRPIIGQQVTATHKLVRAYGIYDLKHGAREKKWERIDWRPGDYVGYYIGYRTFSNGSLDLNKHFDNYTPKERFEVWLIVPNERQKPIAVLPGDCTLLPITLTLQYQVTHRE